LVTDVYDPNISSGYKLGGFFEIKKNGKQKANTGYVQNYESEHGNVQILVPEYNVFSHIDPKTKQVDGGFLDNIFEIIQASATTTAITDMNSPGHPRLAFTRESLKEHFDVFVKTHSRCGLFCPHLLKFYQRIGFLKALNWANQLKPQLVLPKINMTEGKPVQGLLSHLFRKSYETKQKAARYQLEPEKITPKQ